MQNIKIKDIKNINTIEELKDLGQINEIINVINDDINPLKISSCGSYEELFNYIKKLKENWCAWIDSPFKSEKDKYIFILTQMSGKQQMVALNADNDLLYEDKSAAKKWRDNIIKYVHPDKGGTNEATVKLDELYKTMIDH